MAFGSTQSKQRYYFNIGRGQFTTKAEINDGKPIDELTGIITRIDLVTQTFQKTDKNKGGTVNFANFHIEDKDMDCILCIDRNSTVFCNLINSLACITDLRNVPLNISIYLDRRSGYNRITVKHNGEKISWLYESDELPKVETRVVEGQEVRITKKKDDFFNVLLDVVTAATKGENANTPEGFPKSRKERFRLTPEPTMPYIDPDDLPADDIPEDLAYCPEGDGFTGENDNM